MTLPNAEFTDLASYRKIDTPARSRGNIIKAGSVTIADRAEIGVPCGDASNPAIILHREGERITHAEFICQCGRSAILHLEYEQE